MGARCLLTVCCLPACCPPAACLLPACCLPAACLLPAFCLHSACIQPACLQSVAWVHPAVSAAACVASGVHGFARSLAARLHWLPGQLYSTLQAPALPPALYCSLPEAQCFKPSKDKRLRTWKVKQADAEDDYGVEAIVSGARTKCWLEV